MKKLIKIIILAILPTVIITSLSSCIHDDIGDCRVTIRFIYDHNMDYNDRFNPDVTTVDVFVFDAHGKFLFTKHAEREQLEAGNRMMLENIPQGRYSIFAVGDLSPQFKVSDSELQVGTSSVEDVKIALQRLSSTVATPIPHLWVGKTEEWLNPVEQTIAGISLVRNTNVFHITICQADGNDAMPEATYTFGIATPEGAIYGYDNRPLLKENVTYTPWDLRGTAEPDILAEGTIHTMRLFDGSQDDPYRIFITYPGNGQLYWEYDLIKLLKRRKPYNDTTLPMQEYLDRQWEWDLTLYIKQDPAGNEGAFTAVAVKINSWFLWLHDIDV